MKYIMHNIYVFGVCDIRALRCWSEYAVNCGFHAVLGVSLLEFDGKYVLWAKHLVIFRKCKCVCVCVNVSVSVSYKVLNMFSMLAFKPNLNMAE